jgi:hypothetical protein
METGWSLFSVPRRRLPKAACMGTLRFAHPTGYRLNPALQSLTRAMAIPCGLRLVLNHLDRSAS